MLASARPESGGALFTALGRRPAGVGGAEHVLGVAAFHAQR